MPPEVGQLVAGRYQIDGILGQGAMGTVFIARQKGIDRTVALKTLNRNAESDQTDLERFYLEARAAAGLEHPNIVKVYEFGLDETTAMPFIAMEYLNGLTLAQVLGRRGTIGEAEACAILAEVAKALTEAHHKGVIHRDLKPENIFLRRLTDGTDQVKVLDFGIASVAPAARTRDSKLTGASVVLGTPEYMSPEQCRGEPVTPQSDLYALGCVLHEMLVGKSPYSLETGLGILIAQVTNPLPTLPETLQVGGAPSDELRALHDALLRKDSGERPESALEVMKTLETIAGHGGKRTNTLEQSLSQPMPDNRSRAQTRRSEATPAVSSRRSKPVEEEAEIAYGQTVIGEIAVHGPPVSAQPSEPKTNLLAPVDVFLGRESELSELRKRMSERARLITIMGPGGTGKTRLSQTFGVQEKRSFPGGVWFCDLGDAQTLNGVFISIASALDIPLTSGDPESLILTALERRKRALLILDNFEQVVDSAAAFVERCLRQAPELLILVTSRTRLRIAGESVLDLEPLPIDEAVALFYARASAVQPNFGRTEGHDAVVEEIVDRLDCIALAVELAAARIRMLTAQQVLDRLGERFRLLKSGRRDQPERQTTLRGAIDWSWVLLEDHEKSALAQLSVFFGGCTLDAAESVVDLDEFDDAPWVMDTLETLVDHSLLRREEPSPGVIRYRLFESIREYAAEKLGDKSEELMLRHAQFFARFGDPEFGDQLRGSDAVERRRALESERENLVAAIRGAQSARDSVLAARCIQGMIQILAVNGPIEEGISLIDQLDKSGLPPEHRALVFAAEGALLRKVGKMAPAAASVGEALAIYQELGDRKGEGRMTADLGILHWTQGRNEEALEHFTAALELYTEIGEQEGLASVHNYLGLFRLGAGETAAAIEHLESALTIRRALGDRAREGAILTNLGNTMRTLGRLSEAANHYKRAAALHRDGRSRRPEGIALGNLGDLEYQVGNVESAERHLKRAIDICDLVHPVAAGYFRSCLALIFADRGQFAGARALLAQGEQQLRGSYASELAKLLCKRACVEHLAGESEAALTALNEAEEIARELKSGPASDLGADLDRARQRISGDPPA